MTTDSDLSVEGALASQDRTQDSQPKRCLNCGTVYPWPRARMCVVCKTYRNPVRQWLTNFNANGWAAFLAVASLTAATASSVGERLIDHVEIKPRICHNHELNAIVVNGEAKGITLSNATASIESKTSNGILRSEITQAGILALNDELAESKLTSEHLQSAFVGSGKQSYVSLMAPIEKQLPDWVLPAACKVRFSLTYNYGMLGTSKVAEAGVCSCKTFVG